MDAGQESLAMAASQGAAIFLTVRLASLITAPVGYNFRFPSRIMPPWGD